jgi:hypothetical protein
LEVVLVIFPPTAGVPGQVIEEIKTNLPLLRREVELNMHVAGLRWKHEVLQVELKRVDVVRRMSLGKPGRESVVYPWRE